MEKWTLSNGTQIDAIGFGSYKVEDSITAERTVPILLDALAMGYRYIDTAAFYHNEVAVGQAIRTSGLPREEIFLQTKVWKTELGYDKTAQAIQDSLHRLNCGYIDVMMIHWPVEFPGDPQWKDKLQGSYRALEDAVHAGFVRHIGLSNFLPHHIMTIQQVATIAPIVDQLELHIGHMQHAAVTFCKEQGILPQAWSPLGRTRILNNPFIQQIANKYQVTVTDLALRFLLQQNIAVIPKGSSHEHLLANLHPAAFTLSPEDMSFLLTMPETGWSGEHPDFDQAPIDTRFMPQ